MKKTISSEMTLIYKFIFPTVWIGIFGLGTFVYLRSLAWITESLPKSTIPFASRQVYM